MIFLIILLAGLFLASGYFGYRRTLRLDHLNQSRVLNGLLIALGVLTLLSLANLFGFIARDIASDIIMSLFTIVGGFFIGYGSRLIRLRAKAGSLEYMYRSFWADVAPNLIAVGLFVFGIYRLGFLQWPYITGIGITSGVSLMGFGFLGWTVRIVPEFRANGILMLDQFIRWKKIVAYQWISEGILQIDYLTSSKKISEFKTYIPPEDQLIIERLLGKKIKEFEEERHQLMLDKDEE